MEILFRRHFWLIHAAFLAVSAFLVGRTVTGVAGHMLRDVMAAEEDEGGAKKGPPRAEIRDFTAASDQNIFGAKREDVEKVADTGPTVCRTDADCPEGKQCLFPDGDGPGAGVKQCRTPEPVGELDFANAVRSELPLRLVGTSVFSVQEDSLASIMDENDGRKAEARVFSVNECVEVREIALADDAGSIKDGDKAPCNQLTDSATLVRILTDRVYLLNKDENRYEFLDLQEPDEARPKVAKRKPKKRSRRSKKKDDDFGKGISKVGANKWAVTQEEVNKALGNMSKLATQARIVPAFEGGQAIGFKLFSIRPGSLYSKIGIQNGDVIQKVNGYEITSPDKALELYQKLRDGKEFSVDIKRRGKPTTLEYNITP